MRSRSLVSVAVGLVALSSVLNSCATKTETSLDELTTGVTVEATPSVPGGTKDAPYQEVSFKVRGAPDPNALYYWTLSGTLPPGLKATPVDNITPSGTFTISGTPNQSGHFAFKLTVHTVPEHNILVVGAKFAIDISSTTCTSDSSGSIELSPTSMFWPTDPPDYSESLSAIGGCPGYQWTASGLPGTLTLDRNTGTLSGTAAPGSYSAQVTIVDANGLSAQKTLKLQVVTVAQFKGTWTGIITKGEFVRAGVITDTLAGHRLSLLFNDQGLITQGALHDTIVQPGTPDTTEVFDFGNGYPGAFNGDVFQFNWHLACVPLDNGDGNCIGHYLDPAHNALVVLTRVSDADHDTTAPAVSTFNFGPDPQNPQDLSKGQATITFSEAMSSGSPLALSGGTGTVDGVSFSPEAKTATVSLSGLSPGTTYTLTLNPSGQPAGKPGFLDLGGNPLPLTPRAFTTPSNNQTPIAQDMSVSLVHDRPATFDLVATDLEDSVLTYTITTPPSRGNLTGTGKTRTYTPPTGGLGSDSFVFTATDSGGLTSAPATVTLTMTNQAPTATAQSVGAQPGVPRGITLAGSDPDNDSLTYTIVTPPTNGTLSPLSGTALTYTANTVGSDAFTFRVSDGVDTSAPATVTISVTALNQPPTAQDQSVSTIHGLAKAITLAGNDPEGGLLTYTIVTQPTQGTLSGSGNARTYTPTSGTYVGPDSFTFKVTDPGSLESAPATVSIAMTNQTPTAAAQSVAVAFDTPKAITLSGADLDGDPLAFAIATPPVNGTLSPVSGSSVTYTPTPGYSGADNFTFTATDGAGTSAAATVSITVAPPNQPPTATPQSVSTVHGQAKAITLAGTDPENGALTYTIATQPTQGTLSGSGSARTYTPTSATYVGTDSFTFTVTDPVLLVSAPATVSITMTNQAPTASGQSVTVATNTPKVITLTGTDADSDSLTFAIAVGPSNGTLSAVTGSSVTYTPNGAYSGPDSFTFTASDGIAASSPATVSVTVSSANAIPIANSQTVPALRTRQYSTDVSYIFQYAVILTGSDTEDGTASPPLHFKITQWPNAVWDSTYSTSMVAGKSYRFWDPATNAWVIKTATTSTTINPVTGEITVDPPGSPVTFIYVPASCHIDSRLHSSFQFTATDSAGQESAPGTVSVNINFSNCLHPPLGY